MRRCKLTRELSSLKKDYEEDFEDETRLKRRQKRKSVADGKSELNSLKNATKERRNGSTQVREEMLDEDYEECLEYLAVHGHEGHDYLDTMWMDPHYKIFLENLKNDGKACVLEVLQENGNMVTVKYEEEEDQIPDGPYLDTAETLKESQVKETTKIERNLSSSGMKRGRNCCLKNPVLPLKEEEMERPRTRYAMRKQNRRNVEAIEDLPKKKSSVVKKSVKVEAPDPVSHRPNGRFNKMPSGRVMKREKIKIGRPKKSAHLLNNKVTESLRSPEGRPIKRTHISRRGRNHGADSDLVDGDYKIFLDGLKKVGGKKVFRSRSNDVVILEEDEESSSDVEILEESSDGHFASFTAVDLDSRRCIEIDDTSHAQYRKGLMKDLKRPYDEQEYKKLLKEVSRRKPIGHARNMRHTKISDSVAGELGLSYRDRHRVLSRMIDQAKGDRPRILVLLRGFFYWLKNLVQEGSFCPWSDPECLKVLPQAEQKRKFSRNYR